MIDTKFMTYYGDTETVEVAEMHRKFWGDQKLKPSIGNKEYLLARAEFIQEELDELKEAIEQGDYLEQIDALIDIVTVCKGSAVLMGVRWSKHWAEVLRALGRAA